MTLGTILLIILILLLIGVFPTWPHSRGMGLWTQRRARADSDHLTGPDVIGKILAAK